jgi:hypothetical protein
MSHTESQRSEVDVELAALTHEYQHIKNDHHQATADGQARRLHARLAELEQRCEHLIAHLVQDESERRLWRERLYHGGPAPQAASIPRLTLVFKGRSDIGSLAEVHAHPEGRYHVRIDGALLKRIPWDLSGPPFVIEGIEYHEVFQSSPEALSALGAYVSDPRGEPPWRYAIELMEDHLVDLHFSLLPRGRRALALPLNQRLRR